MEHALDSQKLIYAMRLEDVMEQICDYKNIVRLMGAKKTPKDSECYVRFRKALANACVNWLVIRAKASRH